MIAHPFVAEKPRVIPWPDRLHDIAKFELSIGEGEDHHFTIGDTLEEALPRFAEMVAEQRLYAMHRARSWSE